jgi:hypothetical protein
MEDVAFVIRLENFKLKNDLIKDGLFLKIKIIFKNKNNLKK